MTLLSQPQWKSSLISLTIKSWRNTRTVTRTNNSECNGNYYLDARAAPVCAGYRQIQNRTKSCYNVKDE